MLQSLARPYKKEADDLKCLENGPASSGLKALEDQKDKGESTMKAIEDVKGEQLQEMPVEAEVAMPEVAEPMQPEAAEPLQPEVAEALQPEGAEPLQPEVAELLQPEAAVEEPLLKKRKTFASRSRPTAAKTALKWESIKEIFEDHVKCNISSPSTFEKEFYLRTMKVMAELPDDMITRECLDAVAKQEADDFLREQQADS